MVRNTHGGSKTKCMARKNVALDTEVREYIIKDALERKATVTKMYGNGMCQIKTQDSPSLELLCHIRGCFRGRSRKSNFVTIQSVVIIGLREWENPYKICDLISILSSDVSSGSMANFESKPSRTDDLWEFSNEEIPLDILEKKVSGDSSVDEKEEEDIDFDDI